MAFTAEEPGVMFPLRIGLLIFCPTLLLADHLVGQAVAGEGDIAIAYQEEVTAFWGDADTRFTIELSSQSQRTGQVSWALVANRRVLASGESSVTVSPTKPATVKIERRLPPVREGVVLPLQLKVAFADAGHIEPAAVSVIDLWLLADDPFAGRQEWLQSLAIQLFDPPGNTAAVLEKMNVPFQTLSSVDAVAKASAGCILIGEGVSWNDHRSLPQTMLAAARRGVPVISLAPADGEASLPLTSDGPRAARFSLRRDDALAEFDKRLASRRWVAGHDMAACELALATSGETILARVVKPGEGWPWLEVEYERPNSRLVVCCYGLVRSWDQSPVPRYLLARLLERTSAAASPPARPAASQVTP